MTKKIPKPVEPAILPDGVSVGGKLGLMVKLLMRSEGADVGDMMAATGWQQHSVRGALSGALKRQRGVTITSEKLDGPRIYRIVQPPAASSRPTKARVTADAPAKVVTTPPAVKSPARGSKAAARQPAHKASGGPKSTALSAPKTSARPTSKLPKGKSRG